MSARLLPVALTSAALLLAAALPRATAGDPAHADHPRMELRTYAVADLVIPIARTAEFGPAATPDKEAAPAANPAATTEDRLMKLITSAVAPQSWSANGGPGTIDYFPMTMTLVVSQTPDVQEQVADLLATLRRMQDVEVALEVRLISVPEGFGPAGVGCGANPTPAPCEAGKGCDAPAAGAADKPGVAFLNDQQVAAFLEAVQGNQRTNVMQAPKVTLLNGQAGVLNATEQRFFVTSVKVARQNGDTVFVPNNEPVTTGLRMEMQPVVSADRRSVRVQLKIEKAELASPEVPLFPVLVPVRRDDGKTEMFTQYLQEPTVNRLAVEKAVVVPDGGTALFCGLTKVSEGRVEYGPPVLSKVPYVNRLFKNVGYARETQKVLVMVTPRIIVTEEEEARPAKAPPCPAAQTCPVPAPQAVPPAGATEEAEDAFFTTPARKGDAAGQRRAKVLAELIEAYDAACAEGQTAEAAKLARAALALDPTCFRKKR
jgi:type II secretory pathway component GspD/PulD (secretin)